MPPKTPEDSRREKIQVNVRGMLDNAPANKTAYLRLPATIKAFKPQKGKVYRLSFLPWVAGSHNRSGRKGTWVANRFLAVHGMLGPMEEAHLCPSANFGRPCPQCERFQRLRAQQEEWDVIKEFKPRDRELFLVHDEDDNNKKSVMVWDESVHLFGNALRLKVERRSQYQTYPSVYEDGWVVEVAAVEKKMGRGSCVDCTQGIELEPRKAALDPALVKLLHTLCPDDWLVETPYARLKELVGGGGEAPAAEEETQEEVEQEPAEEVEEEEVKEDEVEEEEEAAEEEEPVEEEAAEEEEPAEEEEEEEFEEVEEEEAPPPPPKKKRIEPTAPPPTPKKKTGK